MKLITKDTDNAIVAMLALEKAKGKALFAVALSGQLHIPHPFLRRILQKLATHGMITSKRGTGGGFTLAREPGSVSVRDMVDVFQGPLRIHACRVGGKLCERTRTCVLRRKLQALESQLVSGLMNITLASLAEEETT